MNGGGSALKALAHRVGVDAAERIVLQRVPHGEDIMPARREHTANFAIGLVFVGEEHHAELAQDGVKFAVGERQRGRVRQLKSHVLVGAELRASDFDHSGVEVGRDDLSRSGKRVAQSAA